MAQDWCLNLYVPRFRQEQRMIREWKLNVPNYKTNPDISLNLYVPRKPLCSSRVPPRAADAKGMETVFLVLQRAVSGWV